VELTTHLHQVTKLRLRGAVHPLPRYIFMAWCLVKHGDNFICYICKLGTTVRLAALS